MTLSQTLPRAWLAFKENKKYLIWIVLIEFVFLFVLTQIHLTYFVPSAEAAARAGEIMTKEVEKLQETELYQLEGLLAQNEEFMTAYHELLAHMGFFITSLFAAFAVFRTPLWYISHKSILKKMPFKTVLIKFPLLCLFWFIVLIIAFSLYSIGTGSTTTILPIISPFWVTMFMYVVFLAIFYFSQVSFALIPSQQTFKNTFIYGIKHAKTIIPAFLVNTIILFIACSLPFNWLATKPLIALAIILFITIPALAFARLHMIIATWSKHG
ncbi:MAG: hypothetical protein QW165_01960 [Candidatus Woesearchaeota archaeon]